MQGELCPGLDLHELSFLVSENQWGAVLLWEKGLLRLEQLAPHISKHLFLTLTPLCQGQRLAWMNEQLDSALIRGGQTSVSTAESSAIELALVSSNEGRKS